MLKIPLARTETVEKLNMILEYWLGIQMPFITEMLLIIIILIDRKEKTSFSHTLSAQFSLMILRMLQMSRDHQVSNGVSSNLRLFLLTQ